MKKNKLNLNKIEISSLDSAKINDGTMRILGGATGIPNACVVSKVATDCLCTRLANCSANLCHDTDTCLPVLTKGVNCTPISGKDSICVCMITNEQYFCNR